MKKIFIIILLLLTPIAVMARVTDCSGNRTPAQAYAYISMGTISSDPSLNVGDVIASFISSGGGSVSTSHGPWYIYYKYLTQTPGIYNTIQTNLAGIGVRMKLTEIPGSYFPYNAKGTCSGLISCEGPMPDNMDSATVELVKTAENMQSGELSSDEFAYAQCDNGVTYVTYHFYNSYVNGTTCNLDSKLLNVNLGDYKTTDFTSTGSVTEKKLVEIPITCTGDGSVFSLSVSSADIADNNNGVIMLDSGGATGIGVQLLKSDGSTPIPLGGTSWVSGMSVNGSNTIDLYARYYQLGNQVTSGNATANVTFTFNYN